MNLLFLPLLLPTVIVPALMPIALARVVYLDERGNPIAAPDVEAKRSPAVARVASPVATPAAPSPRPTPPSERSGANPASGRGPGGGNQSPPARSTDAI